MGGVSVEGRKDELMSGWGAAQEGMLDRDDVSGLTLVSTLGHARTHGYPG